MDDPIQSTPPTEEDEFYIEWGRESLKKNIENAHGVLKQLLTLNTSLMGGSIIFLKPENIDSGFRIITLSLFLIALALAFLGILPHESNVSIVSPSDIKTHKQDALKEKRCFMCWCALFTACGLVFMAVGVMIK